MCGGDGGAKVFDLFSKPGPGTHSHRQQPVPMNTSFFMGLGTTVVPNGSPTGLEASGSSWSCLGNCLELELCQQGQLLLSGPEGLRISSNWKSAGASITLGTEQIGKLDISRICLASAAGGLVFCQL